MLKYSVVVSFWFTLAFCQKNIEDICYQIKRIESNITHLITKSRKNKFYWLFRKDRIHLLVVNMLYMALLTTENVYNKFHGNTMPMFGAWVVFDMLQILIYNIFFIFIEIIVYLQRAYHELNKVLNKFFYEKERYCSINAFTDVTTISKRLQMVGQLHSVSTELLETWTNFISLSILLGLGSMFMQLLIDIHLICHFIKYQEDWSRIDVEIFMMLLTKFTIRVSSVYFICSISDVTCEKVIVLRTFYLQNSIYLNEDIRFFILINERNHDS